MVLNDTVENTSPDSVKHNDGTNSTGINKTAAIWSSVAVVVVIILVIVSTIVYKNRKRKKQLHLASRVPFDPPYHIMQFMTGQSGGPDTDSTSMQEAVVQKDSASSSSKTMESLSGVQADTADDESQDLSTKSSMKTAKVTTTEESSMLTMKTTKEESTDVATDVETEPDLFLDDEPVI